MQTVRFCATQVRLGKPNVQIPTTNHLNNEQLYGVDWGLGFGCRFGPMRLLLGLLGFWSRQLLSGSGNPRCAADSAPSAQLLSRLNRSHQLSPFGRALAPVRQQQVSAGYSYPPQLNQPPLRCSQPLQLPTSAGLICLLHLHSSSARPPAVRER